MSETPGHLFVVHGLLERIRHDFAIVPTSSSFSVNDYWLPVLGRPVDRVMPPGWREQKPEFARSPATKRLWFLNIGRLQGDRTTALVGRTCRLVETIARDTSAARIDRPKPLIALPVVGSAGGGLGNDRGRLVRKLVTELGETARKSDVDVVLVIKDASMYAAAQYARLQAQGHWELDDELMSRAQELGRLAKEGNLALFIGAGVGVGAGLPKWTELLSQLARGHERLPWDQLEKLTPLDQAQLLQLGEQKDVGAAVARIVERKRTPALAHALLAGLGCKEAITTNYDRLYEEAVNATGNPVASVLPRDSVSGKGRWVLKMHGDVKKPESIVLTREHFVRYDALSRPSAAMLQSLFVTRHVLIFGASMTDDNVIRLAYEVNEYRSRAGHTTPYGSIVAVGAHPLMKRLWSHQLNWLGMPGAEGGEQGRAAEIFLDALGAYASTDASWLLDERFTDLMRIDQYLAGQARALYDDLPDDDMWAPLKRSLEELGAHHRLDARSGRRRYRTDPDRAGYEPGRREFD